MDIFNGPIFFLVKNNLKKDSFPKKYKNNLKKNNFKNSDFCVCLRIANDYINAKDICIDYRRYFESAFKIAKEKYPNANFHIFTDDYIELKLLNSQ